MAIVIIVCTVVVIREPVWVLIVETYVYVLFITLYSISKKCRLSHYNLQFKMDITEIRKPQINGSIC